MGNGECDTLFYSIIDVNMTWDSPADSRCVNIYDIHFRDYQPSCGYDNWPFEKPQLTEWLNSDDTKESMHIPVDNGVEWAECKGLLVGSFQNKISHPSIFKIPYMIKHGVEMMLMTGTHDLIINPTGVEYAVNITLEWRDGQTQPGFDEDVPRLPFTMAGNGTELGQIRHQDGLWLTTVQDGSHMVPYDHPVASRALLDIFFEKTSPKHGWYIAPDHKD